MSDIEDDFTSINELPETDSEEVAMARRVKHNIAHDMDDSESDDDDNIVQVAQQSKKGASLITRLKNRLFELAIVFVLIVVLTWPSVQDIIDRLLGKTSTVAPVLAKAALGTVTFFLARDFLDSKKKLA